MLRHTLRSLARAASPATYTPLAAAAACAVWGQQVRVEWWCSHRRRPLWKGRALRRVGFGPSLLCSAACKAVRLVQRRAALLWTCYAR